MKTKIQMVIFIMMVSISSCTHKSPVSSTPSQIKHRKGLPGNTIVQYVQDKKDKNIFTDPIDDTINFKKIRDNIYNDKAGKCYILTIGFRPVNSDTLLYLEYFKDVTDFLDLKSYTQIKDGYFANKGKVFYWWGNSDGEYPIEVVGADPKTFKPFDDVAGGTDKNCAFYGGAPGDFEIIQGADPASIKVLNPKKGCWNCGNCYFLDNKAVYYGSKKVKGADPASFKLVNQENVDAEDKHGKYFEGHLVK